MRRLAAFLKNSLKAIFKGEFLLRMRVDKYFMHIVYTFLLVWLSIWLSLKIDTTLTKLEKGKAELRSLEIYHAEKTSELVKLNRVSTVSGNLEKLGSDVGVPEKPATVIRKK